jgi:PAS domain S-box-containing protein
VNPRIPDFKAPRKGKAHMLQFESDASSKTGPAGFGAYGRLPSAPNDDLHSLLERLTDAYLALDATFHILEVSDGAESHLGIGRESLIGRTFWEVAPRAVGTPFEQECRQAMATGTAGRYNGLSLNYLGLETETYFCPRGQEMRIYLKNLASRNRTETALRTSEAKYRKLVSLLPAAVYTCDARGRITLFNQRAAELWGRKPRLYDEEEKYCGSFRLYGLDEQPLKHRDGWMGLTLRTGVPIRDQKIIIERPDGSRIVVSANVEPLFDESGMLTGAINVLQDVTDRQRSEVHDRLQQLLVAAQMQVEAMNPGASSHSVDSLVQRVSSILKDAVAASRALSVELHSSVYQPSELVAAIVWLSAQMEERYGLRVHFRDDRRAPVEISEQVSAVLLDSTREALTNCVKHARVQDAHVTLEQSLDNQIVVIVEDEGRGFDPSALEWADHESGFGLFRVRQKLIEQGGQLKIEASPGRGTRVLISTPTRSLMALPPKQDQEADLPEKEAPDEGIRVLLVDDHRILREGLARLLKGEPDIEIVGEAEDGLEAVELADALIPDVVVMDINLPKMNGIEATRRLRRKNPSVKVVALSMHSEEDIKTRMREAGAEAYILKGAPAIELVEAIRTCVH